MTLGELLFNTLVGITFLMVVYFIGYALTKGW